MNLILLGPPGAGKGTQAKFICKKYDIPHISTGEMFRKNIAEKTYLGMLVKEYTDKGNLVPDHITIKIVDERIRETDCKKGFLLDGFPRTITQAEALDTLLKKYNLVINRVLFIAVSNEVVIERNVGRRVCSSCGASFHIRFNPSRLLNKCDYCLGELTQREDDTISALNNRLAVYKLQTKPLIAYYRSNKLLSKIDGACSAEIVFQNIETALGHY
ncbi:adenylate kinase [Clostridium swellfunianum]|uniref:adenylate kinase n=1 Tax=Clostridium swellfunianum TaxID=1367462 RepID=UPI00202DD40C|nr:adenylate kinase [Clostridium swellfunianum]MCM0649729.1 adenylate kinase [Clostridium swellfunianum]